MSRDQEPDFNGEAGKTRSNPKIFQDLDGRPLFIGPSGKTSLKDFAIDKFDAELLAYWHGHETVTVPGKEGRKSVTADLIQFDPDNPVGAKKLKASERSPACQRCALNTQGCVNPYLPFKGSKSPLITIIVEGIGKGEDDRAEIATDGSARTLLEIIEDSQEITGVKPEDIRWLSMTRCANRGRKLLNLKSRGAWCRMHVLDDLMRHPPQMVMPVGTTVLGLLSHKSNAQEWSGRLLTFRGWPDSWLTNPKYALPRPDPRDHAKKVVGHPVFGPVPTTRLPMVPLQAPRLVYKDQNKHTNRRYRESIIWALKMAKRGVEALDYIRPWYDFTTDPDHIEAVLREILAHPGILLCYDTETTGLRPWETSWTSLDGEMLMERGNARIVSMMFRWTDPETGYPRSLGFPWEAESWEVRNSTDRLRPLIWKVLTQSRLIGHNLTFDMLFTWATLNRRYTYGKRSGWDDTEINLQRDRRVCALADACAYDTWHMAFTIQQKRGSLGLEALAYDWVPDLAGYEEDFTLLIELNSEKMDPAANKGGHYLNVEKDKVNTHLVPYIMGDVEVAYRAFERLNDNLQDTKTYDIPLADPKHPGEFRLFTTHNRHWVYENIMGPASRTLMKLMARGMHVDQEELSNQAVRMPSEINQLRNELATIDPRIVAFVNEKKATEGEDWELDLEDKGQLKELLFNRLELPVMRLTKAGRAKLGDDIVTARNKVRGTVLRTMPSLADDPKLSDKYIDKLLMEYAAVDKFTLNKLTVQFDKLRPLRQYRKAFKLYSTYVRPLQNIRTSLDKKDRKADPHLCFDSCIHASFLVTGTLSARLSCRNPNLQQLPRDGAVKSLFTSRFGARGCMYQGDLSQIELRLLAAASGDPTMVKAYFDNVDLHTLTASRIFSTPYESFTKGHMKKLQETGHEDVAKELDQKRNIAKMVNFLTGYGGGAFGLQNVLAMRDIDKTIEECEEIIELFFDSYPAIKKLLRYYKKFIEDNAKAVSIFGRVRALDDVASDDNEAKSKALRAGCNHLIQSTASDMMMTALFCIEKLMREANMESILVSTVHDSLIIDAVRDELPAVHQIVQDVLNNFPIVFKMLFGDDFDTSWMIVPFGGDSEYGLDYLHMHKLDGSDIDWDKVHENLKN